MDGLTTSEQLRSPFPEKRIHWRVGATTGDKRKGIALAYIDARDVQQRLDEVMGTDWQCRYTHVSDKGVVCEVGLLIDGEWRWRANGAGETDYEATKGAMSDAFKRAAVMWGVGKYLYALPNEWVEIEPAGRSYKLKSRPSLPEWATPEGFRKALGKPLYGTAVREWIDTIVCVKSGLHESGCASTAAEAYAELPRLVEQVLWHAPSKGGIWETVERKEIDSPEFQKMVHDYRTGSGWYDNEENQL